MHSAFSVSRCLKLSPSLVLYVYLGFKLDVDLLFVLLEGKKKENMSTAANIIYEVNNQHFLIFLYFSVSLVSF